MTDVTWEPLGEERSMDNVDMLAEGEAIGQTVSVASAQCFGWVLFFFLNIYLAALGSSLWHEL